MLPHDAAAAEDRHNPPQPDATDNSASSRAVDASGVNGRPLVSVIIPVYNGADFLGAAIASAAAQTYRNLEIIVVDDGSTDGSLPLAQSYAANDPRICVLAQTNAGVASARNRAIEAARGEFLAPLDADDLWLPHKIERQMRAMEQAGPGCGLVYSWWAWIDEHGTVLDRSPRWTIAGSVLEVLVLINFTGNASVPLFRRSALVAAGGYNPELAAAKSGGCEDWEVVLRVAATHTVAVVEDILLGYRRRPGSMSQACDTMWRSQRMVMARLRTLRPDLKPALFRGSENQFRMYLAGLSYWSGNLRGAIGWASRAGLRLPVLAAPYVLRMMLLRGRKPALIQTMRPGQRIDAARVPEPMLPYDRILSPRQLPARLFWVAAKFPRQAVHAAMHAILLARMHRERARHADKQRVMATGSWHFPVYSQTFVYREALALAELEGFDLRFVYAGANARTHLPDDLLPMWDRRSRILYADSTADRDLEYFMHRSPQKVQELKRAISAASGLSEDEVTAHRHFRHAFTFARFAEAYAPHYIHTYFFYEGSLFGYVASQLLGIPRGVSCYADHMVQDYELKLVPLHMQTSSVVIATSARIKRELEEICGRELPNTIVKPNGVDSARFPVQPRAASTPARAMRCVCVNRIHAKKGMTYLVEAARLLRDRGVQFTLEICGEHDAHDPNGGSYFNELREFVAKHNLSGLISFLGRQDGAQVRQRLSAADLFIAPYIELPNGDKDGIPTALLEAMAAGCAVVATDAGSITEVIASGRDGLMVPQCDSSALADAIAALCADDALRERLAASGRRRVEREFDVNVCEARFHERVRATLADWQHGAVAKHSHELQPSSMAARR